MDVLKHDDHQIHNNDSAHNHGEDCDCGHDHHHEHDKGHEHSEDCDCGHDHHHHEHNEGHKHSEDCDCGHDHHHEHDEEHEHLSGDFINISTHDSSIVGTVKGRLFSTGYDAAEKFLMERIKEISRRIEHDEGIVGHIKFFLSFDGRSCQISSTGDEENIRRYDGSTAEIEGVAIVFNIEVDNLRHILKDTLGELLSASQS